MRLQELADREGLELRISYHPRRPDGGSGIYSCGFWGGELDPSDVLKKEGNTLDTAQGYGATPFEAIRKYVRNIKGATMVMNPDTKRRREFNVPRNLRR